MSEAYIGVSEVSDMLGVGRERAYELLRSGQLASWRPGRKWMTTREAVRTFQERSLSGGGKPWEPRLQQQ